MHPDLNVLQPLNNRKLFFPYLMYGFPDEETFFRCLDICVERGADGVEVGIPHSDPVADGQVIQAASQLALQQGVTPGRIAQAFSSRQYSVPLVAMTYGNIVYRYGPVKFVDDFSHVGFSGLVVADFPLEARSFIPERNGKLSVPLLVATTTSLDRLAKVAMTSEGFIYFVSGKGTTGSTSPEFSRAHAMMAWLRRSTDLPVLLGFGIDHPDKAKEAALIGDGVIVGSVLIHFIAQHHREAGFYSAFSALVGTYRLAIGDER